MKKQVILTLMLLLLLTPCFAQATNDTSLDADSTTNDTLTNDTSLDADSTNLTSTSEEEEPTLYASETINSGNSKVDSILNSIISQSESLEEESIALSQFIKTVEKDYVNDFNELMNSLTADEKYKIIDNIIGINTSTGETYFYELIFNGSLINIHLSTSSPNWDAYIGIDYSEGYSNDELVTAREASEELIQEEVESESDDYVGDKKSELWNALSSSMQSKADSILIEVNELVNAAKQFSEDENAYDLAYTNKEVQNNVQSLVKEALKQEPNSIVNLLHYVFLNSPGENTVHYSNNNYYLDYSKTAYEGSKVSVMLNTVQEEKPSDLTYTPYFNAHVTWGLFRTQYEDEIEKAEEDYWNNQWQSKINSTIQTMYDELSEGVSNEGKETAEECISLLDDYLSDVNDYLNDDLTVYDLEVSKFETQSEINTLISELNESERYNASLLILMAGPGTFSFTPQDYPTYKRIYESGEFSVQLNINAHVGQNQRYIYLSNQYPNWNSIREGYNNAQQEINEIRERIRQERLRNEWRVKLKQDLPSSVLSDKDTAVNHIKSLINTSEDYSQGKVGAYDVELERLLTNFRINKLVTDTSSEYRINLTKLILLDAPGNLSLYNLEQRFPTWKKLMEDDNVKIYLSLISEQDEHFQESVSNADYDNVQYVNINMQFTDVNYEELTRAGRDFYLRRQEELVRDELQELKESLKTNLSSNALNIKNAVVDKVENITKLTKRYYNNKVTARELEFQTLMAKDEINDLLSNLTSEERRKVSWLVISEIKGFHNIQYGDIKWEETEAELVNKSSNLDALHYLCTDANLNTTGPLRIKLKLERVNDEYRRNTYASVDCTNTLNSLKKTSKDSCSSEDCNTGEYCYVGDTGSKVQYHTFTSVDEGTRRICVWNDAPDYYAGVDRKWKGELYIIRAEPVRDVLSLSVVTYDNKNIGVEAAVVKKYSKEFVPYALREKESLEWDFSMSVRWKETTPGLNEELNQAYKDYLKERAKVELKNINKQRAGFENSINTTLQNLINEYEAGNMTKSELDMKIEELFNELSYLNSKAARNLGILDETSFPSNWTKIDLNINTENVQLMLREIDYAYEFKLNPVKINYFGDEMAYEEMVKSEQGVKEQAGYAVTSQTPSQEVTETGVQEESEITSTAKSVTARAVSISKQTQSKTGVTPSQQSLYQERMTSEEYSYKTYGFQESYTVLGYYPQSYIVIKPTEEEINREANIIKEQWQNMSEEDSELIIGKINSNLNNNQFLHELLLSAGDLSLSLQLEHGNETIFAVSFTTLGGYLSDLDYDVKENAGNSTNNILIKTSYDSIVECMNYWESNLKYSSNPLQFITRLPGFLNLLWRLNRQGDLVIKPTRVILRLTNVFNLINTISKSAAPAELGSSI